MNKQSKLIRIQKSEKARAKRRKMKQHKEKRWERGVKEMS